MYDVWIYTLISVVIVSLLSFVGILTFSIKTEKLKEILLYMVSFSAGALFGDAFIHLLPEIVEEAGFGLNIAIYVMSTALYPLVVLQALSYRLIGVEAKSQWGYAQAQPVTRPTRNQIRFATTFPHVLIVSVSVMLNEMGRFSFLCFQKNSLFKCLLGTPSK